MRKYMFWPLLFRNWLLSYFLCIPLILSSQGAWQPFHQGIADWDSGERYRVDGVVTTASNQMFCLIKEHSSGDSKNGLYTLQNDSWVKLGPSPNQYGTFAFLTDNANIYALVNQDNKYQLLVFNETTASWNVALVLPNYGIEPNKVDLYDGIFYYQARVRQLTIDNHPQFNFQLDENFVVGINLTTEEVTLIRNEDYPLVINSRGGGGPSGPKVMANGEIFLYGTWEFRDSRATKGLHKWNGERWLSVVQGLRSFTVIGDDYGPIGPLYTDPERTRLLVKASGFFELVEGGWTEFWNEKYGYNIRVKNNLTYLYNRVGEVRIVDRALKKTYYPTTPDCTERITFFTPSNDDSFIVAELGVNQKIDGVCGTGGNPYIDRGLHRFVIPEDDTTEIPFSVSNLEVETATYFGGIGEKNLSGSAILNDGTLLIAGNFPNLISNTITPIGNANMGDLAQLVRYNATGEEVLQSYPLGQDVFDMDVTPDGKIAVVGDFGVHLLNQDFSVNWSTTLNSGIGSKSRIAVADTGEVIVYHNNTNNGTGVLHLFDQQGSLIHTNDFFDGQAVFITDVEIATTNGHNAYYVIGYRQSNPNLQIAYLRAFELQSAVTSLWRCWGYPFQDNFLSEYGADTRLYRVEAANDAVVVMGESAGGGPGGFSIFAYNGDDLETKIALDNNDFYTDGTNSCGACHITYVARVNPQTGIATKGKFIHGRRGGGKTNSHQVRSGDLKIGQDQKIYITGTSFFAIEDRNVFNINGQLLGEYGEPDQVVLTLSNDLDARNLWGHFNKTKSTGLNNFIAINQNKVLYASVSTAGTLFTTANAMQANPYNTLGNDNTLNAADTYFALWGSNIDETANDSEMSYPFIPDTTCFRLDDIPCDEIDYNPDSGDDPLPPEDMDPDDDDPSDEPSEDPDNPSDSMDDGRNFLDLHVFNQITPNGDGLHDVLRIENLPQDTGHNFTVFTSAGSIVYESNNYQQDWDGSFQGKLLPRGTYYYVLTIADYPGEFSGFIIINY